MRDEAWGNFSLLKKFALLVPQLRRLHAQRDDLLRKSSILLQRISSLSEETEHIRTINVELQAACALSQRSNVELQATCALQKRRLDNLLPSVAYRTLNFIDTAGAPNQSTENLKVYAIIGSAGRTATQWLSDAFNLHDDVFFSHGPSFHLRKNLTSDEREIEFLRIVSELKSFPFHDIDSYFNLLECAHQCTVYGNIHGVEPVLAHKFPEAFRRSYFTCAIIRHPVKRIQSFMGRFRYEIGITETRRKTYIEDYRAANQGLLDDLTTKYGADCRDEQVLLFLQAADFTLRYDRLYLDTGMPIYLMERLVSDTDYFLSLFRAVTNNRVKINKKFLSRLRNLKPIDQRNESSITAMEIRDTWASWMSDYLSEKFEEYRLREPYEQLGYNLWDPPQQK